MWPWILLPGWCTWLIPGTIASRSLIWRGDSSQRGVHLVTQVEGLPGLGRPCMAPEVWRWTATGISG